MTLEPITEALVQLVAAVLLAMGTVVAKKLADWLKLSADDQVRAYLQTAIENAITHGVALATQRGEDGSATAVLTHAARYVEGRVPDALKRLGIDQAGLDNLLHARLQSRIERAQQAPQP